MSTNKLLESLNREQNKKRRPKRYNPGKQSGESNLRFFPNQLDPKEGIPYEQVFLHFGFIHPRFGNPSTFRCGGRNCPLCKKAQERKANGDPDAWRFKSTPVFLYYVENLDDHQFYFLRLSNTAHNEVIGKYRAQLNSGVSPMDLDEGKSAVFQTFKETTEDGNTKTTYKCAFHGAPTPVSKEMRAAFESAIALADTYKVYSHKELEYIANGVAEEDPSPADESDNHEVDEESLRSNSSTPPVVRSMADNEDREETLEEKKARIKRAMEEED